jgi:hypothetical protein
MNQQQIPAANAVHRVDLHGGIIGLVTGGARKRLQTGIAMANQNGEELVFVIPDVWSTAHNLFATIILFFTLLLWCPAPGYLIVTRCPKHSGQSRQPSHNPQTPS